MYKNYTKERGVPDGVCRKIMQIMRLTTVILLASLMHVSAAGVAQKITLSEKNVSIESVFDKIRKQAGYDFLFTKTMLTRARPVTINVRNAEIHEVLSNIFENQPLTYTIKNRSIILSQQKMTLLDKIVNAFTQIDVHGNVKDAQGNVLPGATIRIKGTEQRVLSDERGNFYFKNVDESAILIISYLGYQPKEIKVAKEMGTVVMGVVTETLDEVVLIGYGTSTKRLNTGTVSSVTAKDISNQPLANVLSSLSGRIAGMTVTQDNGLPGSGFSVQIRGRNSLSSGTEPLYIVDGVPFSNGAMNNFGVMAANGSISPFAGINPADIERIDVLKDAASTAIYGARGANGVVLITTKRGKTGPATFNVNAYQGAGRVSHYVPMLNTQEYLELRREAFVNDGITPDEFNAPDLTLYDQNAYTDWQKKLIGGMAKVTDIQSNLSAGSGRLRFLVNANYRKEGTVYNNDLGNERIGTRMNLDYGNGSDKFYAKFSASFSSDKTDLIQTDLTSAYTLPPNYPLNNADGSLFWDDYQTNPLAYLKQKYLGLGNTLMGNSTLTYVPVRGLSLKMNLGYTQSTLDQKSGIPSSSNNPVYNEPSYGFYGNSKVNNFIAEPTVSYQIFKDNWGFDILGGMSWQKNNSEGSSIRGENYSSDSQLFAVASAGILTPQYEQYSQYNFTSVFGKINYNWQQKYIIDVSYRRDGSSKFGANNRFGNFASVGAAWLFTKESIVQEMIPMLSFGKLRASFGTTGNDQIPNYLYLPLYVGKGVYDGQPGLRVKSIDNPDIQWETTKKLEFALDLGFIKDRILLTTNYYINKSSNQIVSRRVTSQTGFFNFVENLDAIVENKGLEFELNSRNFDQANFKWSTSFNLTFPKSKLASFPGLESGLYGRQYVVGQPIGFTNLYQFSGVNPLSGVATYLDLDGNGSVDYLPAPIGNPFYGGISNTFSYKSWSIDFLIQFNHRKGFVNSVSQYQYENILGYMANQNTSVLNRWRSETNPGTKFPGATADAGSEMYAGYDVYGYSSANYGDNSFIRFKSINLAYSLPQQWIRSLKMSALSVYFQGQNLYTLTKNKYVFDPETQGMGIGTMPLLRTVVLGVNCTF